MRDGWPSHRQSAECSVFVLPGARVSTERSRADEQAILPAGMVSNPSSGCLP
jgi:hypothetical protein